MAAVTRPTFISTNRLTQRRLQDAYSRLNEANDRVASNKAFRRPSEDPVAASHAAMLQEHLDHLGAVTQSTQDAMSRLDVTDSKLMQVGDLYNRVKELTIQAANSLTDGPGRAAIAAEITQIRDSLVAIANSDYLGEPLFAGLSQDPAVEFDGTTWQFTGSSADVIERRISPSEAIRVNVTAAEVFEGGGTDAFTVLDDLVNALGTNDNAAILTVNSQLDDLRASLGSSHAQIGAAANRTQISMDRNNSTNTVVLAQLSLVRDVDLAEAVTQQKMLEAAYEAALAVTARVAQTSLMDFLR
jgi:flagellar hook-associated protein 3 FlgL